MSHRIESQITQKSDSQGRSVKVTSRHTSYLVEAYKEKITVNFLASYTLLSRVTQDCMEEIQFIQKLIISPGLYYTLKSIQYFLWLTNGFFLHSRIIYGNLNVKTNLETFEKLYLDFLKIKIILIFIPQNLMERKF